MKSGYLVIYEREFLGYKSDTDYEGNANFNNNLQSVYRIDKISKASVDRLKKVFCADQIKRKYKGEGKFFATVTEKELHEVWGVKVEDGCIVEIDLNKAH